MLHVSRFAQFMLWQLGQGQSPESESTQTSREQHSLSGAQKMEARKIYLALQRQAIQVLQTQWQFRRALGDGHP
jgi:hypothetical protein